MHRDLLRAMFPPCRGVPLIVSGEPIGSEACAALREFASEKQGPLWNKVWSGTPKGQAYVLDRDEMLVRDWMTTPSGPIS
jgi:hypothetical protein